MKTFRLEFNESKQQWHHDNGTHAPNSNGFKTVVEYCTDLEFRILESYINRDKSIKMFKITYEYISKCLYEIKGFMDNLHEYNIDINQVS